MRAGFSCVNAWTTKLRTLHELRLIELRQNLLITPDFMRMVPLVRTGSTRGILSEGGSNFLLKAMDYLGLSLISLTCLWDIILVVTFCSCRRIFRRVHMGNIMAISLLLRLSVFCLFQLLILMTWNALRDRNPNSHLTLIMEVISNIGGSIYPLAAFLLLGLRRDILRAWFPCIHFGAPQTCTTGSNWALDKEVRLAIHEDVTPTESLPNMQDIH
ncbi:hypothetical protein JB92DRAFT_2941339 [Gautieria morchelliformis]|nr:hypothetical protein JB92DRAFT_2941339 [Gautieria morchelliformis]